MLMMDECHYEQRRIVAYPDDIQARLASHKGMMSLRQLQSAGGGGVGRVVAVRAG
jgi:hypothetical protein